MKFNLLFTLVFILSITDIFATTVVPFDNLGHLAESSDEVARIKVLAETNDDLSFRAWNVEILESFKGVLHKQDIINLESMSTFTSTQVSIISGDIQLELNQEYLVFLDRSETGVWRTKTLSYYLYQQFELLGEYYYVPVIENLEIHIEGESNGNFVIDRNTFSNYLKKHVDTDFSRSWDDTKFKSTKQLSDFYTDFRAAPAHCTFLMTSGGIGSRWDIFPSSSLEVYCDTEADNGFAGSHNAVGDAIIDLSAAYSGINVVNEGIVSSNYTPNCSGGSAVNGNFTSYANALNGGDNSLIIFNDPCSQIPNLSGCSGTLAIGGSFGSTPFNTWDGSNWYTSRNAYVIVNNGTGACQSTSGYTSMLTHEMTHGLGLSHIATSDGTANMNPSCCSDITGLDIDCVDYLYTPTGGIDLILEADVNDITCNNLCNGSISITGIPNGTGPFTYSWSNGGSGSTISSLCEGTFSVTVTDANTDTGTGTYDIIEPSLLTLTTSISHTSCGANNGSVSAFPGGGTPLYSYNWSNGSSNATISNLDAGNYSLTVTDINGCIETSLVNIVNSSSNVTIPSITTNSICSGEDAIFTISGGPGEEIEYIGAESGTLTLDGSGQATIEITEVTDDVTITLTEVSNVDCNISINVSTTTTVFDNPTTPTITASPFCAGEDAIFTISGSPGDEVIVGAGNYTLDGSGEATITISSPTTDVTITITSVSNANCVSSINVSATATLSGPVIANISSTNETAFNAQDGTATASQTGGTNPISYEWSNGPTSPMISGLEPGIYTVTITDGVGCIDTEEVTIQAFECPSLSINSNSQNNSCYQSCDGSIVINDVVNGIAPFTYNWNTGSSSSSLVDLCIGTYMLTIVDAVNCSVTETYTITEPSEITLVLTSDDETSFNANNGTANCIPSDGVEPYTYLWSNGETEESITGLSPGNYTLTVTDNNDCIVFGSVDILAFECPELDVISIEEDLTCGGNCIGLISITNVVNASLPLTYLWSDGSSFAMIDDLCAGTYSVTIVDADNCEITESYEITEPDLFEVTVTIVNTSCGLDDGSIYLDPEGGIMPYTYAWSNDSITNSIIDLVAGLYTYTITDANGCVLTDEVEILSSTAVEANITIMNESSFGADNGTASCSPTGGTPGYTYNWSNGESTPSVENLAPEDYTVTITDSEGCFVVETFTITSFECEGSNISFNTILSNCFGDCENAIGISNLDNGPYSIMWSTGATTDSIFDLCDGLYSVTIVDNDNCTTMDTFMLLGPDQLLVSIDSTNESSFNGNDGSAFLTTTGGTIPYTYLWSNGATNDSIIDLSPGIYYVTVSDINNCSIIDSVTIDPYICEPLILNDTIVNVLCNGVCDGEITTSIQGGDAPYNYEWSTGDDLSSIESLCPGWYYLTLTDAKNCILIDSFEIVQPDTLLLSITSIDESAFDANDGMATSTISGGITPYSYEWSTGDTTSSINNLAPGVYTVTVTDANACVDSTIFTIASFGCTNQTILYNQLDPSCFGNCDGQLTITGVDSSAAPFMYLWSTGDTTNVVSELCSGNYFVTIIDNNGCNIFGDFLIFDPDQLTMTTDVFDEMTFQGNDGSATANPEGGTEPYSYEWSSGDTTMMVNDLSPGIYSVLVKDMNLCEINDTITIDEYVCDPMQFNKEKDDVSCFNACDGSATVEKVTDDTFPLYYLWNTGDTTSTIENLCPGTYTVTMTDMFNCSYVESMTIEDGEEFYVVVDALFNRTSTSLGAIDVSILNEGGFYYYWNGPMNYTSSDQDISNLVEGGCYILSVTDTLTGCSQDTSICIQDLTSVSNNILEETIRLYPNPTTGISTIDFSECRDQTAVISVMDTKGKLIYKLNKKSNETKLLLDLLNLQEGLFLIKIEMADNDFCYKKILVVY